MRGAGCGRGSPLAPKKVIVLRVAVRPGAEPPSWCGCDPEVGGGVSRGNACVAASAGEQTTVSVGSRSPAFGRCGWRLPAIGVQRNATELPVIVRPTPCPVDTANLLLRTSPWKREQRARHWPCSNHSRTPGYHPNEPAIPSTAADIGDAASFRRHSSSGATPEAPRLTVGCRDIRERHRDNRSKARRIVRPPGWGGPCPREQ